MCSLDAKLVRQNRRSSTSREATSSAGPSRPSSQRLRAACGLTLLLGAAAREHSSPSTNSGAVSCKPANPQDSIMQQCNSWCKADREHSLHCTVRHALCARHFVLLAAHAPWCSRGSFANARAAPFAEARCVGRLDLPRIRHRCRRRRFALRQRQAIPPLPCVSRGASASSPPSTATIANVVGAISAVRCARRCPCLRRRHHGHRRRRARRRRQSDRRPPLGSLATGSPQMTAWRPS